MYVQSYLVQRCTKIGHNNVQMAALQDKPSHKEKSDLKIWIWFFIWSFAFFSDWIDSHVMHLSESHMKIQIGCFINKILLNVLRLWKLQSTDTKHTFIQEHRHFKILIQWFGSKLGSENKEGLFFSFIAIGLEARSDKMRGTDTVQIVSNLILVKAWMW